MWNITERREGRSVVSFGSQILAENKLLNEALEFPTYERGPVL